MWDDYGPMVYRSCDPESTDPLSYDTSWKIYTSAKTLVEGALQGDVSKSSMWLGCTGCGPYNISNTVYEQGKPIDFGESNGFDAFARDILILKHFGIPTISIFHGLENFEARPFVTGFFDQYGFADALDKLNETVNGVNSTQPFTIYSDMDWNPKQNLVHDYILNFNRLEYLGVFGSYILIGILFAFHKEIFAPFRTLKKISKERTA
ncbi:MAG: hypothetical protein ACFFCS_22175 [Candidatus Hodarchaeota archaeon]